MGENDQYVTIIGPQSQLTGEMTFERAARIEGRFEGKITGQGQLYIAESAECKAEIQAGQVVIDGFVQGNIVAVERVQLNAKGRVQGDVTAPKMVIADGAVFVGGANIGGDAIRGGRTTKTSTGAPPKEASAPVPARR